MGTNLLMIEKKRKGEKNLLFNVRSLIVINALKNIYLLKILNVERICVRSHVKIYPIAPISSVNELKEREMKKILGNLSFLHLFRQNKSKFFLSQGWVGVNSVSGAVGDIRGEIRSKVEPNQIPQSHKAQQMWMNPWNRATALSLPFLAL